MPDLRHNNCQNADCKICLEDHELLCDELEKRTGRSSALADHLGEYRKWFDEKGMKSETEHGWACSFVFDEANIKSYLHEVWGEDGFGEHP